MDHRGRFQAQGGGLEESAPWDEANPLPALTGHIVLSGLEYTIGPKEAALRREAFVKGHRFIDEAAANGGVGFCKKSYVVRGRRSIRVDVEVRSGMAFV